MKEEKRNFALNFLLRFQIPKNWGKKFLKVGWISTDSFGSKLTQSNTKKFVSAKL